MKTLFIISLLFLIGCSQVKEIEKPNLCEERGHILDIYDEPIGWKRISYFEDHDSVSLKITEWAKIITYKCLRCGEYIEGKKVFSGDTTIVWRTNQ